MTQSHFTGGTIVPPAPSLASRGGVVGKHHFTGELVADFSGARVVYFESHLEMQVLEVLRARPDVADVAEQPPRVTWRDGSGVVRHHTFDFLVTLRSGERVAVAVKPAARVISSGVRVALAEIAAQIDPAFAARIVLVTDRGIDPVEVRNAMGVDVRPLRLLVIACATLMTAAAVAMAGVIGWVGLMVPHMARLLIGPGFDRLLPASVLIGAGFMVLVDTAARSIAPIEVPLGILAAVAGAPAFVGLLARGARGWAE